MGKVGICAKKGEFFEKVYDQILSVRRGRAPMRRFVRTMSRIADRASVDSEEIRSNESKLENSFQNLQSTVRKVLLIKPRRQSVKPLYAHPPQVARRQASKRVQPKPLPELPDKDPNRNFALPRPSTQAAARIYRSAATQHMYQDVVDGYQEYLLCPTRIGLLEYESQIDPYLHVGDFPADEVSQIETGAITGVYSFY